jgi:hypothetical protein
VRSAVTYVCTADLTPGEGRSTTPLWRPVCRCLQQPHCFRMHSIGPWRRCAQHSLSS